MGYTQIQGTDSLNVGRQTINTNFGRVQHINALDFGCNPNWNITTPPAQGEWGTYDNLTPLRNAIAEASSTGKTLYIPKGVYMIQLTGTGSSGGLNILDNVNIVGDGEQTVLVTHTADVNQVGFTLFAVNADNWSVRDICLHGNKAYYTGDDQSGVGLFRVSNANNFRIQNCFFKESDYLSVSLIDANKGFIESNQMINTDCGVIFEGNASEIFITNNITDGAALSEGIVLWQGDISDVVIDGNIIKNHTSGGGIVTGNAVTTTYDQNNITISNNVIENQSGGIWVRNADHVTVTGNVMSPLSSGIKITNSTFVNCVGNNVRDNGQSGFEVGGGSTDIIISGNVVHNPYATGSGTAYGYVKVIEGKRITVTNNNFTTDEDNDKTCVFDDVDGLIFKDNIIANLFDGRENTIYLNSQTTPSEVNCVRNAIIELGDNQSIWNYYQPVFDGSKTTNWITVSDGAIENTNISSGGDFPANSWNSHTQYLSSTISSGSFVNLPNKPAQYITYFKAVVTTANLVLANTGNITWATTDTINTGSTAYFTLMSTGNGWVEIGRSVV